MRKYFILIISILILAAILPQTKSGKSKRNRSLSSTPVAIIDTNFNTGNLDVSMNLFGRIQLFDAEEVLNLYQFTPLVAVSPTSVFDYWFDSGITKDTTRFIHDTTFASDTVIYGAFDNSYSNPPQPPNILVKTTIYFWKASTYALVKYTVINRDSLPMNARPGMEILSQVDGTDGFDTVKYVDSSAVLDIYKQNHVGIKLLSGSLKSVYSFNFLDGYENDSSYYSWMTHDTLDSQFNSSDTIGAVTIVSQDIQNINPGDSITFFYGLCLARSYSDAKSGLDSVYERYSGTFTGIKQNETFPPTGYKLYQNYPNPFNPTTTISFSIARNTQVSLKVYNILGQEVANLLNEVKNPGKYSVHFDSRSLTSGIYFYELKTGEFSAVKKMIILK